VRRTSDPVTEGPLAHFLFSPHSTVFEKLPALEGWRGRGLSVSKKRGSVLLSEFDYELPKERIALHPLPKRDASWMLVVDRAQQAWEDRKFGELPDILRGDELLVVNTARVLPARLRGRRKGIHAQAPGRHSRVRREFLSSPIEVLLTRQIQPDLWEGLVRPGRKVGIGERLVFGEGELEAEVTGRGDYGVRQLHFESQEDPGRVIERLGHMPLPPYIDRPDEPSDRERYQTVFARPGEPGTAVAAPTAGLHFTPVLLDRLRLRGVEICEIRLDVGLGTFQPIHTQRIESHRMHSEPYEISEAAAEQIKRARGDKRPVVAVGTTVVRALEDSAQKNADGAGDKKGTVAAGRREAEIFIHPGHRFRVVDQMLTNFHLPKSSLLVMVAAFTGREFILRAYVHAVQEEYRFYSYGDCMLIR
jgi:S-adenosylmethionine:tRNA ribosyltransferase-isomerase